ncbi:MAG: hypothetical protein ACI8PB_003860 [Desulforhopalus sp.]|jgi:hypothetical protein
MTDYTPDPTYQYLNQLIETKTPIVPMLSYVGIKKKDTILKELNIIYYDPNEHALSRIFNNDFAAFMLERLLSFELGMSSQVLAGIVRSSKPSMVEQWSGDTIEKVNFESFSLYKGLLSIVGKNDGLPLVVPQNIEIVGDIVPGIKQFLNGKNPTIIRQKIKQLETLQYRIADIIGDNPLKTDPVITDTIKCTLNNDFHDLSDKQIARLEKLRKL